MASINPKKTPMYWMNTHNMHIEKDDIVHWWGGGLPNTQNKVVISNYGPYYLDMGVGNYLGSGYGSYLTWLDLYNRNVHADIQGYSNKANVLGAEVCLWSEMSNRYTHHQKIWIRSSSLAERLWNSEIKTIKPGVLRRITAFERILHRKGIPTAPATCQQCETFAQFC
jgi:hexosaminidase